MPTTYCKHCGSANHFESSRPKFCNECGQSFDSAVAAVKRKPAPSVIEDDPVYEEIDNDQGYENTFGGAGVSIQIPRNKGVPFKELISEEPTNAAPRKVKVTKAHVKRTLSDFQKKAKAINPGDSTSV